MKKAISAIKNRLILVDGIFGGGKSTTAKYISDYSNKKGLKTILYEEEEPANPLYIDYCEHGNAPEYLHTVEVTGSIPVSPRYTF